MYDCNITITFQSDDPSVMDGIVEQLTFLPAGALVNTGVSESQSYQTPDGGGAPELPASS